MKRFVYILIAIGTITAAGFLPGNHYYHKAGVINAKPEQLHRLGRHLIAGYSDYGEVKQLVSTGAVGGIYLSKRNIAGKSVFQIQKEIDSLQQLQQSFGRQPLFIATDQEGGIVSRFSPPMTKLPPLSDIVANSSAADLTLTASRYAAVQAEELSHVGVNLNFSPVVDLKYQHPLCRFNIHSQIYKRAISGDPLIVSEVALAYSKIFERNGIFPTLKHFPGLGRISTDTHISGAELDVDIGILEQHDWLPFKNITEQTGAFIMLGHVKLNQIDKENLTSFSPAIIQGILRDKWHFDGILITDDLNMGAIIYDGFLIERVAVKALNAGVDLLLISSDCRQYYTVMHAIIRADNEGKLNKNRLAESDSRLKKITNRLRRRNGDIRYAALFLQ